MRTDKCPVEVKNSTGTWSS